MSPVGEFYFGSVRVGEFYFGSVRVGVFLPGHETFSAGISGINLTCLSFPNCGSRLFIILDKHVVWCYIHTDVIFVSSSLSKVGPRSVLRPSLKCSDPEPHTDRHSLVYHRLWTLAITSSLYGLKIIPKSVISLIDALFVFLRYFFLNIHTSSNYMNVILKIFSILFPSTFSKTSATGQHSRVYADRTSP